MVGVDGDEVEIADVNFMGCNGNRGCLRQSGRLKRLNKKVSTDSRARRSRFGMSRDDAQNTLSTTQWLELAKNDEGYQYDPIRSNKWNCYE